jgi:hypothetical protein
VLGNNGRDVFSRHRTSKRGEHQQLSDRVHQPTHPRASIAHFGDWRVNSLIGRVSFAFLALGALGGCSAIEVGLGLRLRLDKVPVTEISATLSPDPGLGPGKSGRLIITATTSEAKQLVTVGAGHGNVLFDSFTIAATTVTVSKKGVVSLPADPRVSEGAMPHILIAVVGHPDVTTALNIPIRYDIAFVANFAGKPGFKGIDGLNGLPGSSGTDGSNDPANPSAGGAGSDGTNGEDGRDGDPGQPGEAVHVWMTLKSGDHPLLQVRAASKTHTQLFLIDPNGGSLTVNASGGAGGAGGSGGRGGQGGSGGNGFPPGFSGQNGRDGMDGHEGADGPAGTISVSIDSHAQPYLNKLQLINKSGGGGPGPAPEIRIEAVAPLW